MSLGIRGSSIGESYSIRAPYLCSLAGAIEQLLRDQALWARLGGARLAIASRNGSAERDRLILLPDLLASYRELLN